MSDNPFSYIHEELDKDLDSIVFDMYQAHKLGMVFNPIHHRFFQLMFSLIPSLPKRRYTYEVDADDNLLFVGKEERRKKPRNPSSHYVQRITVSIGEKVRHIMLPRTQKVRNIA